MHRLTRLLSVGFGVQGFLFGGVCLNRTSQLSPSKHEIRVLAGYSPSSPTVIGTAPARRLAIAELSYSYRCWQWNGASISYTGGIIPAVVLRQPDQLFVPLPPSPPGTIGIVRGRTVYGFAVMPLGFLTEFSPGRRLHPIAEVNGGIVASTEPIPIQGPNATGLNFLFNFGGGVRWNHQPGQAVTFGYRFLHISNAGTTAFNPGVDNNVFYVSYSFLR